MTTTEEGQNTSQDESSEGSAHSTEQSRASSTLLYRFPDFILLHRTNVLAEIGVFAGLLFLLVISRLPAFQQIQSAYIGGFEGDAGLYIWLLKSNFRDLFSEAWFNTKAFFPYTQTLAWSDNFILPAIAALPFYYLGLSHILIYNSLLIIAFLLNGYCTYRLAYRLSGNHFPAFTAGAAFMLIGYNSAQLGHPQLQFAFFLPLGISTLFSYLAKPGLAWASLFGFIVSAAFLTTVYYALFLIVAGFSVFVSLRLLRPYQYYSQTYILFIIGSAVGLLPLVFVLSPYFAVQELFGSRGIYEAFAFAASGISYFSSHPLSLFYSFSSSWTHAEAYLFPGVVLYLMVALAFLRLCEAKKLKKSAAIAVFFLLATLVFSDPRLFRLLLDDVQLSRTLSGYVTASLLWATLISFGYFCRRMGALEQKLGFYVLTNRSLIACFFLVSLIFFALSLGPLGNPEKGELPLGVFTVFYQLVPGFNSMRAISRAGVVVLLCFSVLLAYALPLLRLKAGLSTALYSVILALILLENHAPEFPIQSETREPPIFHHLKGATSPDDVVMVLPFTEELKSNRTVKSWGNFARLNTNYMHWTFPLGMRTVNGYSGQRTHIMKNYPRKMSNFPDKTSLNALGLLPNLRFVVYCSRYVKGFNRERFLKTASLYPSLLKFVSSDDDGNYLFEYVGKVRLSKDYFLRVPSHPLGFLNLELQAFYEPESPEYKVKVYEQDHFGTPLLLTELTLKANGEWANYAVFLPEPANRARPFRIQFDYDDKARLLLGKRHFLSRSALASRG